MSFPPPPPSNQPPHQPPQGDPGGFGPPGGGYGAGGQQPGPGGYGPGGYGPSAPPAGPPPAGPYGAPAGGYGPPGPGGWQQPPAPPSGGGNGTTIALIIGAGVLVVALVIGGVIWANSDGGGRDQARPGASTSAGAGPSVSDSASPTPSDSASPSGGPETSASTPTGRTAPFYTLKTGDCFDIPPGGNGGNNLSAPCTGPHDAEVVFVYTLPAGLTSESEIKDKASSLCSIQLPDKASKQPAGTAEGTYVQFPNTKGYKLGIKSVVCSLTGNRSNTKKLTKPLV
ncbi:hypothetical protein [Streptomyces noursei]|uniref:hypothetical protein n=1 Tax=Streptomyces noursei TaxID=1971 RepID=UPI0016748613|nr:hypothetical protein [Streptomyces noursei]MCZ1019351.1 hypothetical protein [Streptomyces noursei]GGX07859.1 hypothetical protein GCM10010341_31690 [Streptomyces noursei]